MPSKSPAKKTPKKTSTSSKPELYLLKGVPSKASIKALVQKLNPKKV